MSRARIRRGCRRVSPFLLLFLLWCDFVAAQAAQSITLSNEAKKNLKLEVAPAARRDIYDILTIRGLLREQADRLVWVTPTARGQVMGVSFKVADRVSKGDVLLTLHCPELEKLRTELAQGLEQLALLQPEVERARSLVEKRILPARYLARAEAEHSLARTKVDAARRGILLLGMTEPELDSLLKTPEKPAYLPIHSPISGRITQRNVYQGEMVEPGARLFMIMDTSVLWAEGDVFERDVPSVREGQTASLELRPFKEWKCEGVIKAVSADLNAQKRTAHVWIEVKNPDERLKPQMAVDISILLDKKENVLAVPREAVLEDQGESFVFVTNGDAFLRQRVVLGKKDHRYWEIREGLYEGDQVVIRGNHELQLATTQGAPVGGHIH